MELKGTKVCEQDNNTFRIIIKKYGSCTEMEFAEVDKCIFKVFGCCKLAASDILTNINDL